MRKIVYFLLITLLLPGCKTNDRQLIRLAEKIHEKTLTVDTHCDTPMEMAKSDFDLGERHTDGCVDFPRMIEGGLNAEFFAVFTSQGPRIDSVFDKAYGYSLEVLKTIHKNVEKNSNVAEIAYSPDDAYRLKKAGKISA